VCNLIPIAFALLRIQRGEWTDSAVRRYVRDAGEELERLHILVRSDVTTRNDRKLALMDAAYTDLEMRIAADPGTRGNQRQSALTWTATKS